MNSDQELAKSIFLDAAELASADERNQLIESRCGDNEALRLEVEDLLRHEQSLEQFLERPAVVVRPASECSTAQMVGKQVGPYRLREQIGEGGMGVVYVAEQTEPVRRKVALKIIKPGMASKDVVGRFEAERQALAMMDHPHIAKVHDGGTTDSGLPYFVMELVPGLPITEYCDEHRLNREERLRLFVSVCWAVQHAHQKGIIHRDLKPSNVIVSEIDDRAIPKVIDFGVAKAIGQTLTEETLYTKFSQLVGTPLYMSPEQTGLGVVDIDTRSDVYSLGVLLYELLTGHTPFDSETLKEAGFDEMRRIIREDEPLKPSAKVSTFKAEALTTAAQRRGSDPRKLASSLAGELDWLVMKALEKDRNRRYESASALAADVQRYLAGEAVEAGPPSTMYRFRKYVARHQAALTTAAVLLSALLLGVAGTGWQAWRATENLRVAEAERANAVTSFRDARDAVDSYLTKLDQNEQLQNPDMHSLRQELLEVAREYYQRFVEQHQNNPVLQTDLAEAYRRLGDIAWTLGDYDMSDEAHRLAVATVEKLAAAHPDDEALKHDLATTALAVASARRTGQEPFLKKAIEASKELVQPAHRLTFAKACSAYSEWLLHKYEQATSDPEQRDLGRQFAHQSEQVLLSLSTEQPESEEIAFALAEVLQALANHYNALPSTEAEQYINRSIATLEKLVEQHPDNAKYRFDLASAYAWIGPLERAIAASRELVEREPNVVRYQLFLAQLYRSQFPDRESVEQAVAIGSDLSQKYPENYEITADLGVSFRHLGLVYQRSGELAQAVAAYESAIEKLSLTKPHLIGELRTAYVQLRDTQHDNGNVDAEKEAAQRALEISQEMRQHEPDNPRHIAWEADDRISLANIQAREGRLDEAIVSCKGAIELVETALDDGKAPDAPMHSIFAVRLIQRDSWRDLGRHLAAKGKHEQAADSFRRAIDAEAAIVRDVPRSLVHESPNPLYDDFVSACQNSDRLDEIEPMLRQELTTWRELEQRSAFTDTCQLRQLEIQLRLAEHLMLTDRPEDAAPIYDRARQLFEALIEQDQIRSKTIRACTHVISLDNESDLQDCPERTGFIETLRQRQDAIEASTLN